MKALRIKLSSEVDHLLFFHHDCAEREFLSDGEVIVEALFAGDVHEVVYLSIWVPLGEANSIATGRAREVRICGGRVVTRLYLFVLIFKF